jgi:hypothetical protein
VDVRIDEARPRAALQPHHFGAASSRGARAVADREDPTVHSRRNLWLATRKQRGLDHRP